MKAGHVTHPLRLANNDQLEIFDWPGEYAQRFDGVAPGGGDRQRELQRIYEDNGRTAAIRMEQETAPALVIRGAGTCRSLLSGHQFTLDGLPHADGSYVLTSVQHTAGQDKRCVSD